MYGNRHFFFTKKLRYPSFWIECKKGTQEKMQQICTRMCIKEFDTMPEAQSMQTEIVYIHTMKLSTTFCIRLLMLFSCIIPYIKVAGIWLWNYDWNGEFFSTNTMKSIFAVKKLHETLTIERFASLIAWCVFFFFFCV